MPCNLLSITTFCQALYFAKPKMQKHARSKCACSPLLRAGFFIFCLSPRKLKAVQIKVYCFEQQKNGEAFGVRLSWQLLSPSLSFIKLKGKAAPVPQHSKISPIFLSSDLCTGFK
jgi:hypothetical protein